MADESAGLTSGPDQDLDPAERRLLAAMPLHAITSVHGQAGLRERLLMEIDRFPAADRGRVRDALALACRLHAADRRQREPYANHLSVTWNHAVTPSFAMSVGCHPGAGMLTVAAPSGTQLPSRTVVAGPACCAQVAALPARATDSSADRTRLSRTWRSVRHSQAVAKRPLSPPARELPSGRTS
jgi:hypothetical protein